MLHSEVCTQLLDTGTRKVLQILICARTGKGGHQSYSTCVYSERSSAEIFTSRYTERYENPDTGSAQVPVCRLERFKKRDERSLEFS